MYPLKIQHQNPKSKNPPQKSEQPARYCIYGVNHLTHICLWINRFFVFDQKNFFFALALL